VRWARPHPGLHPSLVPRAEALSQTPTMTASMRSTCWMRTPLPPSRSQPAPPSRTQTEQCSVGTTTSSMHALLPGGEADSTTEEEGITSHGDGGEEEEAAPGERVVSTTPVFSGEGEGLSGERSGEWMSVST
jgi:hypothetical protein